MEKFLNKLFESNSFDLKDLQWNTLNIKTFVNKKSETYIVLFTDLIEYSLINDVFNLCADELYITDSLTKAQKSNLSIVIVSKIDFKLTDIQRNIVYKIEESDLYYKKFILWYSEKEIVGLNALIGDEVTPKLLNNLLIDKTLFDSFKNNQDENSGYGLLSRIYIKLQFLTLNELETVDKSLSEYFKESINELNIKLFDHIINNLEDEYLINKGLELIELSEKELSEIEKEIRELVEFDESK